MRDPIELEIEITGLTLTAQIWGEAELPTLLAVHGWLDNAQSFAPLAAQLPEFRLIALELPGHGHSGHWPGGVYYHFVDCARVVLEAMDALGLERTLLVGHSLGGAVAAVVAGAYPERIEKLVFIDAFGTLVDEPGHSPQSLRNHVQQWNDLSTKQMPVYPDVRKAAVARVVVGDLDFDNALLLTARGTRQVPGGVTWRTDPRWRVHSALRLTEPQCQAFLAAITAPVLYVQASRGLDFVRQGAALRKACVADLRAVEIAGGHHVHMQNAPAVAAAMRDFLQEKFLNEA